MQTGAMDLLKNTAQGMQVWYNVTGTLPGCIAWNAGAAPSVAASVPAAARGFKAAPAPALKKHSVATSMPLTTDTAATGNSDSKTCTIDKSDVSIMVAWSSLVCNEGINLVNTVAYGLGNDLYWPPTLPQDYTRESVVQGSMEFCSVFATQGIFGLPTKRDEWGEWIDTLYGGTRMQYISNIFYTNGNLDPWAPAGVLPDTFLPYKLDESVISRIIDLGGHHLDLFWATENDPESVIAVREEQKSNIMKWIQQKRDAIVVEL